MAELEFEAHRMSLWKEVCVAVAGAEDCKNKDTPAKYADAALEAFDLNFRTSFILKRRLLDLEMFNEDDELEIMD